MTIAKEGRQVLADFGLGSCDGKNARLNVTGWDIRLLRHRLAIVLAGVDDLTVEWDALRLVHDKFSAG